MTPASIRLAKAAMIVFFMGLNSPVRKILMTLSQDFAALLDKIPVDGTAGSKILQLKSGGRITTW